MTQLWTPNPYIKVCIVTSLLHIVQSFTSSISQWKHTTPGAFSSQTLFKDNSCEFISIYLGLVICWISLTLLSPLHWSLFCSNISALAFSLPLTDSSSCYALVPWVLTCVCTTGACCSTVLLCSGCLSSSDGLSVGLCSVLWLSLLL